MYPAITNHDRDHLGHSPAFFCHRKNDIKDGSMVNDFRKMIEAAKSVIAASQWRRKIITALIVGLAFQFGTAATSSAIPDPGVPSFSSTSFTVYENVISVGTLAVSGVSTPVTWEFQTGIANDDRASFTLDTMTGTLAFAAAPDFENPGDLSDGYNGAGNNIYAVLVSAVLDETTTISNTIVVTVLDHNWNYSGSTTFNVDEGSAPVLQLSGVTQGGAPVSGETFTLLATGDADSFTINNNATGEFSLVTAADWEVQSSYNLEFEIGVGNDTSTVSVIVDVTNWDLTNLDFVDTSTSVTETSTAVGNLTVTKNPSDAVTYSLEAGGADNSLVSVDETGTVTLNNPSDYENQSSYEINVAALSSITGESTTATLVILVNNSGPASIGWVNSNPEADDHVLIAENVTFVDTITASLGGNSSGPFTFVLFGSGVGNNNDSFTVEASGAVNFASGLSSDYESLNSYSIDVMATDAFGETSTATMYIDVVNSTLTPEWENYAILDSSTVVITEYSNFVDTITASALVNSSGPFTFSLVGSEADNESFTVDTATGALSFANGFVADAESKFSYVIEVEVSDSAGETATATLNVAVQDNGPYSIQFGRGSLEPEFGCDFSYLVPFNGGGDPVTGVCENYAGVFDSITATQNDGNYTGVLAYSLTDSYESGLFSIDSSTGELSVNRSLLVGGGYQYYNGQYPVGFDYEFPLHDSSTSYYTLEVLVSDGYETATQVMDVYVGDVGQVVEFSPSSLAAAGGPGTLTVTIGRPTGLLSRAAAVQLILEDPMYYNNYYDMNGPLEFVTLLDQAQGWRYSIEYAPVVEGATDIQWTSGPLVNLANGLLETQTAILSGLPQGDYLVRVGYADLMGSNYGNIFYFNNGNPEFSCSFEAMYGNEVGPKNWTPGMYLSNYCYRVLATSVDGISWGTATVQSAIPVQGPQGPTPVIVFAPVTPGAANTSPSVETVQVGETVTVTLTIPVAEIGTQGATGATGATGPQGSTGATGPQGSTGAAGPQGSTGAAGPQGATGAAGPQGAKGDKGATSIFGVISFVNSSATLKSSDRQALRQAGIEEGATIVVSGYTSKAGSTVSNQRLSKKRADAIAKEIKTILPKVNVRTVGFGEKQNKACAKLQNRCVIISVTQAAKS
jgi:outer membrane protein OmpA-like peptidoglycan-associated protein